MDEALDVRLQLLSECVGGEASYVRAVVLAKRLCEEAGGVDRVKSRCLAPRAAPPAAAAHATAEPTFFARPEAELLAMHSAPTGRPLSWLDSGSEAYLDGSASPSLSSHSPSPCPPGNTGPVEFMRCVEHRADHGRRRRSRYRSSDLL